ncbi:MAG: hypothetical protein RLZZ216_695 [Cyanobacteriota bacterium]
MTAHPVKRRKKRFPRTTGETVSRRTVHTKSPSFRQGSPHAEWALAHP